MQLPKPDSRVWHVNTLPRISSILFLLWEADTQSILFLLWEADTQYLSSPAAAT